jgi:hypothetical protein
LNKITDLKSAPNGGIQEKKFAREISKEFFVWGNAKHAHLAEDNDPLTQKNMVK